MIESSMPEIRYLDAYRLTISITINMFLVTACAFQIALESGSYLSCAIEMLFRALLVDTSPYQ